jgi:hypothetical protein
LRKRFYELIGAQNKGLKNFKERNETQVLSLKNNLFIRLKDDVLS